MGQDKCFVDLDGQPMIQHVLDRVHELGVPIMVIGNHVERFQALDEVVFPDLVPGAGSLGGVYTALFHSSTKLTLCVACDMPLLNVNLIRHLLTLIGDCDAVVPIIGERPQGLHALYHQRCLKPIQQQIARDELRIRSLYDMLSVRFVTEAEIQPLDPALHSFWNVNTPDDLARARLITHPAP